MEKSVLIVVPCHRVIGTNGSLTGYAGGLYKSGYWNKTQQPSKVYFN
jgi:methylated-DNA-[protein]-cysteine S-methyltransferase